MDRRPFQCGWADCQQDTHRWGAETCREHALLWAEATVRAQEAALDYGDSIPGYWDVVDADPAWRRYWWGPKPVGRRPIPVDIKCRVAERHGGLRGRTVVVECPRCGSKGEIFWNTGAPRFVNLHIDHVHPVSRGGTNGIDNLQLLCPRCNMSKGARVGA